MSDLQINSLSSASPGADRQLSRLREAAGQIVGSLFYGTLLKSMRESGLKGEYGHGGRGEEVFSAQLHGVLAEKLGAASAKNGLADNLFARFEKQSQLISAARTRTAQRTH